MIQVFWRYVEYYKVQSSNSVDLLSDQTDHCLIHSFCWDKIDETMTVKDTFSKIDVDVGDVGVEWWQGRQLYSQFAGWHNRLLCPLQSLATAIKYILLHIKYYVFL